MSKFNLATAANATKAFLVKRSPEILTGIGIAGMITTTIVAVKATPKAARLLEDLQAQKKEPLTKVEVVKSCWKYYIPAAATGIASVTCLIGANRVSVRRTAALAAAYQISETALTEYRDKVIETIGEKKEKVVIARYVAHGLVKVAVTRAP